MPSYVWHGFCSLLKAPSSFELSPPSALGWHGGGARRRQRGDAFFELRPAAATPLRWKGLGEGPPTANALALAVLLLLEKAVP